MILLVCLALENGLAHQFPIVVAAGEGNDLRTYGIKEFSVSDQSTALMEELAAFEAEGCKVTKMTTAKATYIELGADDYADVPAIKLLVK